MSGPWKSDEYGIALICGQVPGNASLWGVDFRQWAERISDNSRHGGNGVVYRPQPLSLRRGDAWHPNGVTISTKTLEEDLARAACVATFNSMVGVEAVLAGVPTIATDQGSMAWEMATHDTGDAFMRPDRSAWMHYWRWTSWLPEELQSGAAVERLLGRELINSRCATIV